eukprot:Nk52_evm47s223 gene=Nk52_evmTU47s223
MRTSRALFSKALLLGGCTNSGKTFLGIELAKRLNGEIINCDIGSMYRDFDIGTAKPSVAHLKTIPHHLVDIFSSPTDYLSAGDYFKTVQHLVEDIQGRGKVPIIVGGSSFYWSNMLNGLRSAAPLNMGLAKQIELEVKNRGWHSVYEEFEKVDPVAAKTLTPNDTRRLGRFYSHFKDTGKKISECEVVPFGHELRAAFLYVDRQKARDHILERCSEMLNNGLLEETIELVKTGSLRVGDRTSLLIGYKSALIYLQKIYSMRNENFSRINHKIESRETVLRKEWVLKSTISAGKAFVQEFLGSSRKLAKRQAKYGMGNRDKMLLAEMSEDPSETIESLINLYECDSEAYAGLLESQSNPDISTVSPSVGKMNKIDNSGIDPRFSAFTTTYSLTTAKGLVDLMGDDFWGTYLQKAI